MKVNDEPALRARSTSKPGASRLARLQSDSRFRAAQTSRRSMTMICGWQHNTYNRVSGFKYLKLNFSGDNGSRPSGYLAGRLF